MLRLLVTCGHEEQIFALPEEVSTLGSDPGNDIVLPFSGVSRRHALLTRIPGGIEVKNARSKNGVLVERQPVEKTVLTPGLRVQVGTVWLEAEEVSTSEEVLVHLCDVPEKRGRSLPTATVEPQEVPGSASAEKAALDLAYHIAQVGVGIPKQRADLLLRINAVLQAEAFATFDRTRFGNLRIWESIGAFSSKDTKLLTDLAGDSELTNREEIILKRSGKTLIAGRDSWLLAARFPEEPLAREGWRKEFLRFLVSRFFMPVRNLDEINKGEAIRVRELMRGNKKRAAELLGVCRNTLDKLLG